MNYFDNIKYVQVYHMSWVLILTLFQTLFLGWIIEKNKLTIQSTMLRLRQNIQRLHMTENNHSTVLSGVNQIVYVKLISDNHDV